MYVTFSRELEDGLCEMTCTLNIAADLLDEPRGYKYVVYSPKMTNKDDCYEYLHSFASYNNPNRCFMVNKAYLDGM